MVSRWSRSSWNSQSDIRSEGPSCTNADYLNWLKRPRHRIWPCRHIFSLEKLVRDKPQRAWYSFIKFEINLLPVIYIYIFKMSKLFNNILNFLKKIKFLNICWDPLLVFTIFPQCFPEISFRLILFQELDNCIIYFLTEPNKLERIPFQKWTSEFR